MKNLKDEILKEIIEKMKSEIESQEVIEDFEEEINDKNSYSIYKVWLIEEVIKYFDFNVDKYKEALDDIVMVDAEEFEEQTITKSSGSYYYHTCVSCEASDASLYEDSLGHCVHYCRHCARVKGL